MKEMLHKLRYIFPRKTKWKLVFILVLIIIGSFFELLGVAAIVPLITVLVDTSTMLNNEFLAFLYAFLGIDTIEKFVTILILGICAVYVIKNVYLTFMQNTILNFIYKTRMELATRLLTTYLSEPYTFHLEKNVAELQRCLQVDAQQFMLLVNNGLQLIAEVTVCIALGLYLFHTSHSITIVLCIILGGCVGLFFMISKKISIRLGQQNQRYNAKLIQWINQALGGIKEVKILERENFFVDSYRDNYKKLIKGAKNNEMLATVPKYIVETACICAVLLAILGKMYFGRFGIETFVPQLSAFAVAAMRLLPSVGKMNSYINSIMYCLPSLDLIYHDIKEVDGDLVEKPKRNPDSEMLDFKNSIHIHDVSYRYPNTDVDVLHGVSLDIQRGTTVALIGSSGAGKTTLADVILGLLPPQTGSIKADDWNVYEHMSAWHKLLGYIPQSIYLSDDSIRNNVAFGIKEEKIDDEAVTNALKEAQLYDFVMDLPEGWNTYVGDRGVRLSGGQRQRIGIARALYHDPEILVLDEATSALDNETEQAVMDSIDRLQGQKTILIIAHRLTTIRKADKIYEVHEGVVVERSKEEIFGN